MPYLNYNIPIQRTGYRPYGHTDTWAAVQLSGLAERQLFSTPGGRRLGMGQWQSGFSPAVLHGLGLPGDPNCDAGMPYDVNGDPCFATTGYNVPDVTPAAGGSGGGSCLSAVSGLAVPCPSGSSGGGAAALGPGPSPRVPVSSSQFPATSYQSLFPTSAAAASPYTTGVSCPAGHTVNAVGQCVSATSAAALSTWSQLAPYVPVFVLGAIGLVLLSRK